MKRFCGFCLFTVLFTTSVLTAGTIEIPLTGAIGAYSYGNSTRNISIDLMTTFSTIDKAWIKVAGRVVPGLAYGSGIEGPGGYFSLETNFSFRLDTDPTVVGVDWVTSAGGTRFYLEKTLVPSFGNPSWDFLLDGQGDLCVSLYIPDVMIDGSIVSFAYGNIFQVSLIVEGEIIESQLNETAVWPQPGDANHDGMVDAGDLGILAANYGKEDWLLTYPDFDFNGDGYTDVGDLGIFAANYGSGEEIVPVFEQGDFNYDGKIDVGDLGILAANYGYGVSGVGETVSLPEPLSLIFLSFGAVVLSRYKMR